MGPPKLILVHCLLALPLLGRDAGLAALRGRARAGEAAAQFELGDRCHFGRGVPRNPAEAAQWYRLAAEQGHAGAQLNLGNAYLRGEGLARNPVEGYAWLALAAAQGQPGAEMNRALAAGKLSVIELRRAEARARDLEKAILMRRGRG